MSKSGKKKTKRNVGEDDIAIPKKVRKNDKGPQLSKSQKKRLAQKKKKMSSKATSSSQSASSKELSSLSSQKGGNEEMSKAQCDLCKLSYSSKAKLTEHLVSLMHHTKLEDAEEHPEHDCALCNKTFSDMASYRDHIGNSKHLRKLEMLRGPDKEKQENVKKLTEINRKVNDMQESRNQNPGYYSQHFNNGNNDWQESNFHQGQRYNNYQESRHRDQFRFGQQAFHSRWEQQYNQQQPQYQPQYYRGKQNNWDNAQSYNGRWDKNDRADFNSYSNGNRNMPWGSGMAGVAKWTPYDNNRQANYNKNANFTQDRFEYCWDEQSFQQHEDFLANMDQGYSQHDMVEFHPQGRQSQNSFNPHTSDRHNGPGNSEMHSNRRWDVSSFNDRKRPRHEDYPLDPLAKSSKPLNQEAEKNSSRMSSESHTETLNTSKAKSLIQYIAKTVSPSEGNENMSSYQEKSSLDNASDTILERAERLCKELREKREASSAERANLLKSQNQHSLNDKMNKLKKSQQSYLKGHLKNVTKDQGSSGESTISTVTSAGVQSSKEQSLQHKPSFSSSASKIKTLDEIRKSIEQSVLDDSRNSPSVTHEKVHSRIRANSLSESSSMQMPKGKTDSVADQEGRQIRLPSRLESSSGSKSGSKPPISKENLNKMVNCPRSRTERLQLARMFHSRADSNKSSTVSSRSNINLEGLYDSHSIADIELDVGGNMPTIKLEELSDDVRSQILGLIHGDIGITQADKLQVNEVHGLDIADGNGTRKDGSVNKALHAGEKDSSDKKSKKKNLNSKSHKKNKMDPANVDIPSLYANPDKVTNTDFVSQTKNAGLENVESYVLTKSASVGKRLNEQIISEPVDPSANPLDDVNTSPRLTRDNILSRYPTIMGSLGTNISNTDTGKSPRVDDGKDKSSVDSGRSSMSITSSSLSLSTTSLASSLPLPVTCAMSSMPSLTSISLPSSHKPTPIEEAVNLLSSYPPPMRRELPNDPTNVRTSVASSVNGGESSNTMSELLTLSEQEECVKQEMMSMELRLTRLHRLLEQAVYQINKCTERRNELQEEEKSLTRRRLSLLREAASSSSTHQDSHSSATSSTSVAQTNSTIVNTPIFSASDLPPTPHDSQQPETSLSRSEWLAKFSAFLPSDFISPNQESSKKLSHPNTSVAAENTNPSITSTSTKLTHRPSTDLSVLQMVPERDMDPPVPKDSSYITVRPMSSVNRQLSGERSVSESEDIIAGGSNPLSNVSSLDQAPGATQEFTSPIMYVGTFKSGAGHTRQHEKAAPVMTINSATISSLFSGSSGEIGDNLNPVKIVGLGDLSDVHKESSIPSVTRRSSLGSPRQEDSDIGSIASVASGSSLGEQISRYCRYTPGASIDGRNPHDLSIILSGPSDTSDLRGLEDEDDDLDRGDDEKLMKLKEDAGNNRLYSRLDQESIKSAEALHLMERNSEVPSSTIDKKKKKRKTKHQRDSGIRGRSKPYVISSSSADENEMTTAANDSICVSSLEQRLRKSPESTTDDDSSDQPITRQSPSQTNREANANQVSPTKSDQGREITVAECDSSTHLGMVDSQSLNESSSRLKEMNESFLKTFGRKPRYIPDKINKSAEDDVVVLSDSNDQEGNKIHSEVIDLCDDNDSPSKTELMGSRHSRDGNARRQSEDTGPVCFVHYQTEKIFIGLFHFGFKIMHLLDSDRLHDKQYPVRHLSCMEVSAVGNDTKVFVGSGDSICKFDMLSDVRQDEDLGTTVKCLHVMKSTLFIGLDTGEMCVWDIKSWKSKNRYICSDCPIHCMASGSEGGTRVLCVASQDSTITVVDADRCLPLRILVGHSKTAFSVQVHGQYVFSGSGDSTVVIHNLHTARVENVFQDNQGMVNAVFYSHGYLFTGGMDSLVRCYNVKTHLLVQVYYGAGMGVIKAIYVHLDKMLITGNSLGEVDVVALNFKAKNVCKHKNCGLNFGLSDHLAWHVAHDH